MWNVISHFQLIISYVEHIGNDQLKVTDKISHFNSLFESISSIESNHLVF